jgi:hypothetical protein
VPSLQSSKGLVMVMVRRGEDWVNQRDLRRAKFRSHDHIPATRSQTSPSDLDLSILNEKWYGSLLYHQIQPEVGVHGSYESQIRPVARVVQ